MTRGFTGPVNHCVKWNLTNPTLLTKTATSHIYKVNGDSVLKLLTPLGMKDEAGGAIALKYFNGNGAVRLLQADEGAQLVQFVEGEFLKSLDDREATKVFCQLIQKLHASNEALPSGLPSMEENFRALFAPSDNPLLKAGAKLARELLASDAERVVLHGDLHHKNVLGSGNNWLAIDPKGLIGERAYDFANIFYNPDDQPALVESRERILELAETFSTFFKIEQKRILQYAFAYGCLSASWAIEDGMDPSRRLRIAKLIHDLL